MGFRGIKHIRPIKGGPFLVRIGFGSLFLLKIISPPFKKLFAPLFTCQNQFYENHYRIYCVIDRVVLRFKYFKNLMSPDKAQNLLQIYSRIRKVLKR